MVLVDSGVAASSCPPLPAEASGAGMRPPRRLGFERWGQRPAGAGSACLCLTQGLLGDGPRARTILHTFSF